MTKRTLLLAALAPSLALGACGTDNRGLESIHQPVVSRADYVFDVATAPGGIAPAEQRRLAGWLGSLRLGYGDRVAIDDPTANFAARDDVAAQTARFGLLLTDDVPVTQAPVAPGTVRVVVSRMRAEVPGCPDFSRSYQPNFNAHTSSNQGCAVNSTLAAMVANPTDLVRGEDGDGINDPATARKAIDTYRKAANTGSSGLKSEGTGGK